jgi:Zn finger protein HypA/HybF involved in hydrogenase expression
MTVGCSSKDLVTLSSSRVVEGLAAENPRPQGLTEVSMYRAQPHFLHNTTRVELLLLTTISVTKNWAKCAQCSNMHSVAVHLQLCQLCREHHIQLHVHHIQLHVHRIQLHVCTSCTKPPNNAKFENSTAAMPNQRLSLLHQVRILHPPSALVLRPPPSRVHSNWHIGGLCT